MLLYTTTAFQDGRAKERKEDNIMYALSTIKMGH